MGLQSIGTLAFASQVLNAVPSPHLSQEQVYGIRFTSHQCPGYAETTKSKNTEIESIHHTAAFVGVCWYLVVFVGTSIVGI